MTDPIGLAGLAGQGGMHPHRSGAPSQGSGPDFKAVLIKNLSEVNAMQQDATRATEDLMTGRRDDVESVILATNKADAAFKMLQSMRNQVMQAYDEIKQMRV
jgi:flagellar hook-basal body complex protein FliE